MKRFISVLAFLTLIAAGASAQMYVSAGGGLHLDYYSVSRSYETEYWGDYYPESYEWSDLGFGAFGFIDLTYLELDLFLAWVSSTWKGRSYDPYYPFEDEVREGSFVYMNFGLQLFGKYPIVMKRMVVSPMLGIGWSSYHDFYLLAGAGFRIPLSYALDLKIDALFGYSFYALFSGYSDSIIPQIRVGAAYLFN